MSDRAYRRTASCLLLAIMAVAGCANSGYRKAALPCTEREYSMRSLQAPRVVGPGTQVRMHMRSGDTVSGMIVELLGEEVVLTSTADFASRPDTIPCAELQSLEAQFGDAAETGFALTTMAIIAGGLAAAAAAFASAVGN